MATYKMNPNSLKNLQGKSKEECSKNGKKGIKITNAKKEEKRKLREAIKIFLELPTSGANDLQLENLGVEKTERNYRALIIAKLFSMAMSGDMDAIKTMLQLSGQTPDEERKDEENRRKNAESLERIRAMQRGALGEVTSSDDTDGDVVIYMPELEKEEENATE